MKTTVNNNVDVKKEVQEFSMKIGFGMAALIGIWGLSCLIGGLIVSGPAGLIAGFLTVIGI